jgi:hypothetical protein
MYRQKRKKRTAVILVGCRPRVFENRVLMRILEPKYDEVTGEWRRLHNEELYAVYSSPDFALVIKSGRLKLSGHVARMEEWRGACRVLLGKPGRRRIFGRPRHRWEKILRGGAMYV